MVTIPIHVCGDHWLNPNEVRRLLKMNQSQDLIELDLLVEGPCLRSIGLVDMIENLGIDSDKIIVVRSANPAEKLPYRRIDSPLMSHFIWMNDHYWTNRPIDSSGKFVFGYFIGRITYSRASMMYYITQRYPDRFLTSCMNSRASSPWKSNDVGINLERFSDWVPEQQQDRFLHWWQTQRPGSIDGHDVGDQYQSDQNTNQDLLAHYHLFDVELVAESYTLGDTFFMTEKTVRPIMAGKPMLVYGPRNYLKRLRDLGFCTWDDVWDEGYDSLEGPDRWHAMIRVIEYIVNHHDSPALLGRARSHREHNHQVLGELKRKYRPG